VVAGAAAPAAADAEAASAARADMYSVMLTRRPRAQNGAPQVGPGLSPAETKPKRVAARAMAGVICLKSMVKMLFVGGGVCVAARGLGGELMKRLGLLAG
jgi:hypothetical protein